MNAVAAMASVIGVSLLSLLGILFFLIDEKTIGKVLLYFVSFSTGALLGDVFIHILPEMAENGETFPYRLMILLFGILASFAIEKIVHWRHCHLLPEQDAGHNHSIGIMSAFGEGVHNFIDGLVIGASYLAGIQVGIATTLAVVFHEIPHEIGNFAVLLHSGFSRKKALNLNILSASTAIVGTAATLVASNWFGSAGDILLPFAAGNLLYIAGSDLIPELHKQTGVREGAIQLGAMVLGMAFMYLVLFLE